MKVNKNLLWILISLWGGGLGFTASLPDSMIESLKQQETINALGKLVSTLSNEWTELDHQNLLGVTLISPPTLFRMLDQGEVDIAIYEMEKMVTSLYLFNGNILLLKKGNFYSSMIMMGSRLFNFEEGEGPIIKEDFFLAKWFGNPETLNQENSIKVSAHAQYHLENQEKSSSKKAKITPNFSHPEFLIEDDSDEENESDTEEDFSSNGTLSVPALSYDYSLKILNVYSNIVEFYKKSLKKHQEFQTAWAEYYSSKIIFEQNI